MKPRVHQLQPFRSKVGIAAEKKATKGVSDLIEQTDKSIHERLSALESKCAQQEAKIDGLVGVISDMLAAHVVLHKDLRLCTFLKDGIDGDIRKERAGGTERIPPSYFASRADLCGQILQQTAYSGVFDQYWSRSPFWRKEERQRADLQKIRAAVAQKLEL